MPIHRPTQRRDHRPAAPTFAVAHTHPGAALTAAVREPLSVGSFRFWFRGQRWEWSDEVSRMHGYEPGTVEPTTELVLSHKHPDDRTTVQELLDQALHSGKSFSSRHRILDTTGDMHSVIVVADRIVDEAGAVVGTAGYYIDLTHTLHENRQEVLDEALPKVVESRATIEQAKGALMLVYGINGEQAFSLLRWRSQQTNTKVRALAEQLIGDLTTLTPPGALRSEFDHLFLTVHQRVPAEHAC
jgi:ANTAR domain/PAS fold